jgi:tetratricopeptide (TPR) repeat protein
MEPNQASSKKGRLIQWALAGLCTLLLFYLGWVIARQVRALTAAERHAAPSSEEAAANLAARGIPPRDPQARPELIDLSAFYTTALTNSVGSGERGNNLAELPLGLQKMAGIEFDVRGFIQLLGSSPRNTNQEAYAPSVADIPVGRKAARLHVLHGSVWHTSAGARIGSYVVRYADGQVSEFPIIYGEHVQDFWYYRPDKETIEGAVVAWKGENADIRRFKGQLRLYKRVLENPRPQVKIATLDFLAHPAGSAPFLVAVTAEEDTPDMPGYWLSRAQNSEGPGNSRAALAALEAGLQRLPDSPVLWSGKGQCLEQAGKTNEAVQAFSKAIELGGGNTNEFQHLLRQALLRRSHLYKEAGRSGEAGVDFCQAQGFPIRDPKTSPRQVDLSLLYNRELFDYLNVPAGSRVVQSFAEEVRRNSDVAFDLRGVVRLAGAKWAKLGHDPAPDSASGIPVAARFQRMRVLHGTAPAESEGVQVGAYVLHYADGQSHQCPVLYGRDLRDREERRTADGAVLAWNWMTPGNKLRRLYMATYENPRPEVQVTTLDFISALSKSGPFLIAITVE